MNTAKTFKNFFWLFSDKIIRFLVTLIATSLIARNLGPELFGKYGVALAFANLLGFFTLQSLDQVFVKNLITQKQRTEETLGVIVLLRLGGGILLTLLGLLCIVFFKNYFKSIENLSFVLAFAYVFKIFDFSDLWFQSKSDLKWVAGSRSLGLLTSNALRIYCVLSGLPLISLGFALVFEFFTTGITSFCFFLKKTRLIPSFDHWKSNTTHFLKKGFPLLCSGGAILFYTKVDQILLNYFSSASEVGFYFGAMKILDYANVIPMLLSASIFPTMVEAYSSNNADPQKRKKLEKSLGVINWCVWVGATVLFFLSPYLVKLLLGDAFEKSALIFKIVCFCIPAIFFSVIRQSWLTTQNQLKQAMYFELLVMFVSLSLHLVLIPKFHAVGAAWAFLITTYLSNLIAYFLFKSIRQSIQIYFRELLHVRHRWIF